MTYHLAYDTPAIHGARLLLSCALVTAAACGDSSAGSGTDSGTGTTAGPGSESSESADASSDSGDSGDGGGTSACVEYEPGEAGGEDFTPLLTEEQLAMLDLTIEYPDAPIAAIDASARYLAKPDLLRVTFAGLVKVNQDLKSTALEFHDIPLAGLSADNFELTVDGEQLAPDSVTCTGAEASPVTVVFLVDVTGSMSPVIAAVRDSLHDFVDAATGLGLTGKIGVVTFQDTVGVNIPFEDCSGVDGPIPERSPFFPPVSLEDADGVNALRDFINALHADRGADFPENLAAAVDFAANNVIGTTLGGAPNVIGEGDDDPPFTEPWPLNQLEGLVVLIGITDASFHGPAVTPAASWSAYAPRAHGDILDSLGGVVVSTIDPAVIDVGSAFEGATDVRDADFWPRYTGGFGRDRYPVEIFGFSESVSFFDLELLLLGQGLIEIPLAPALAATCVLDTQLPDAPNEASVSITHPEGAITYLFAPEAVSY